MTKEQAQRFVGIVRSLAQSAASNSEAVWDDMQELEDILMEIFPEEDLS